MIGHFSMQQKVTNQQAAHYSGSCLTTSIISLVPRQLSVFQCYTQKNIEKLGVAWDKAIVLWQLY